MTHLLSDDIRLGVAMGVKEVRGRYMTGDGDDVCGCALGTGAFAAGWTVQDYIHACKEFLPGEEAFVKFYPSYPLSIIRSVSAKHWLGASRLEIADWLEGEERKLGLRPALEPEAEKVTSSDSRRKTESLSS